MPNLRRTTTQGLEVAGMIRGPLYRLMAVHKFSRLGNAYYMSTRINAKASGTEWINSRYLANFMTDHAALLGGMS